MGSNDVFDGDGFVEQMGKVFRMLRLGEISRFPRIERKRMYPCKSLYLCTNPPRKSEVILCTVSY